MKNYFLALVLMLPAAASHAGGYDISGNGDSLRALIGQADQNCRIIQTVKRGEANRRFCEDNSVGCNYAFGSLTATNVNFDDTAVKNIIPISYKPPQSCGTPCTKRLLTFITRVEGKLIIDTREVDVDNRWAHENVVGIKWKDTNGKEFGVKNFEPARFTTKIKPYEEDSLVSTIQKNKDKDDLKDLSCETTGSGGGGRPSAETRSAT